MAPSLKFLDSYTSFFNTRRAKTNIRRLIKFVTLIVVIYIGYSILFHFVAAYEGQDHSWFTGFYWVLTTMSTLGYGDIVFTTDLGRMFSMVVLFSGMLFLLVMLPFTFIEFFYAPWIKSLSRSRAPKKLDPSVKDHVLITELNSVTEALIRKLIAYKIPYVILEPILTKALELADAGYKVLNLDPTDFDTYANLNIQDAKLVIASGSDTINTNITFTVKEYNPDIKVVATADVEDSVDILQLAGADHVLQLGEILGRALARRTIGGNARVHIIGHIDDLVIGEATVQDTPYVGKTLRESRIRETTGITVAGIWKRGVFKHPLPDSVITAETALVLAGSVQQLRNYDELVSIYNVSDQPVMIIGGGRVGRAAARSLEERQIDYRIIDKDPTRIRNREKYILGDAAAIEVLEKAGMKDAHTVLITTHNDDMNIYLTIYCRQLFPDIQIISRATYEKNINTLHRAGADFVMSYASMGANSMFNILEGQDVLILAEGLNIFNHIVNKKLAGKRLADTVIRSETGCTVLAINSNDEMIVSPEPDRVIQMGDELILIGSPEDENLFSDRYE